MPETIAAGAWVEIHCIVLTPDQRAPQVPQDTAQVPLEMRAKGFLAAPAVLGEQTEVITAAGRRLTGRLSALNPPYDHGFGTPIAELSTIGGEVRALLLQARTQDR